MDEATMVKEYNALFTQYKQLLMQRAFNRGADPNLIRMLEEKLTKMKAEILAVRAQTSSPPS